MTKEGFELPTTLFVNQVSPMSTLLVEYGGVEHEAQDGSNIEYLSTYRINVWIVAGYKYATTHLEGGGQLRLEKGYEMYDAVLDVLAGRKLLKDAETVRLGGGERVYFGMAEISAPDPASPWDAGDLGAVVYKLSFSVAANSVWQQFPGQAPIRPPS
jgi:hypothetical protein